MQSDEPTLYCSLRTAEQISRGTQLSFLDLPGAADGGLSPSDNYQPGLPVQRASDTDYFAQAPTPAVSGQPRAPRLTLLDFLTPSAHFFSVLLAGKVLSLCAGRFPSLFPSPWLIDGAAHYLSQFALTFHFLLVFFRNYTGPFHRQLRTRTGIGSFGRLILRIFGRRGWHVWNLTRPFFLGLLVGLLSMCFFVIGPFLRSIWDSLTTPAPAPPPAPAGGRIFDSEPSPFSKALRSFTRLAQLLMGVAGLLFLFFGTVNLMTDRPFIKYYINAVMSFSMIGMIWLLESMSRSTTVYDFGDLAN